MKQATSAILLQWQGGYLQPISEKKHESKLESSPIFGVKRKKQIWKRKHHLDGVFTRKKDEAAGTPSHGGWAANFQGCTSRISPVSKWLGITPIDKQ